jgi:hypothetical protein
VLLDNLLRWARAGVDLSGVAGEGVLLPGRPGTTSTDIAGPGLDRRILQAGGRPVAFTPVRPGLYTVTQRGSWGAVGVQVVANVSEGAASGQPAVVTLPGAGQPSRPAARPWWPWLGSAALLAVLAEWLYALRGG